MKSVQCVLVCVALVGCQPNPTAGKLTSTPVPSPEPCRVGKAVCVVKVDGLMLIRAPTFWLLDLRGRSRFDAAKVVAAGKRCDGPQGCGSAMTSSEIAAMNRDLARPDVLQASIGGMPVTAYLLEGKRIVVHVSAPSGGRAADLGLLQSGGLECIPGGDGDCANPPRIPVRNGWPQITWPPFGPGGRPIPQLRVLSQIRLP
jgi:hypothetical protein